jgi:chemotaxis protein CheX
MIANVDALVKAAVTEVFETMVNVEMLEVQVGEPDIRGEPQIASAVGFTGQVTGVVYFYTTAEFAGRITHSLLGMGRAEVPTEEMVNDAMGEIANMVVGHFKSRLMDRNLSCVMTIPSIVRGTQFGIEAVSHTETKRLRFHNKNDSLLVEILIQGSKGNVR